MFENSIICNTGIGVALGSRINFDVISSSTMYYVRNSTGDFCINLRGSSSCTLNALMPLNSSLSVSIIHTNASTPYSLLGLSIDGTSRTPTWAGGGGVPSGIANATNIYSLTAFKTGDNLFRVFGSLGFSS